MTASCAVFDLSFRCGIFSLFRLSGIWGYFFFSSAIVWDFLGLGEWGPDPLFSIALSLYS